MRNIVEIQHRWTTQKRIYANLFTISKYVSFHSNDHFVNKLLIKSIQKCTIKYSWTLLVYKIKVVIKYVMPIHWILESFCLEQQGFPCCLMDNTNSVGFIEQ